MPSYLLPVISIIMVFSGGFLYKESRRLKIDLLNQKKAMEQKESEMKRKMYEIAILKELGDRIGYSLDVHQIIDIITGSLKQFIDYSAVSYMFLGPEKIIFKVHLEKSVNRKFVNEVEDRMLKSLSALLNKDFKKNQIEEILSGAILIEDTEDPVRSFFNIPLAIGGKVVGILTVAHTAAGLYKEEEMTILYKITSQASQAVTKLHEVVETEQKKLNAMVESMSEGVIMTDKEYRIMVVNPAAKRDLGLLGKQDITIFDLIDNLEGKFDIRGKLEESVKLDKILESGEILIKDKFFQIFVSPVKSINPVKEQVEILGGVVILRDITHKKELDKLREDFTSMMVHELRSPLDAIAKMTEFMQKSSIEKDKNIFLDYPKLIHESSSHMLELVNDLLDIAKIEAGKFKIIPENTNIMDIINGRVKFFETSAKKYGIKLSSVLDKNIPKILKSDPRRLSQILNNLISNALKFTKENGEVEIQALIHKKGGDYSNEAKAAEIKWLINENIKELKDLPDSLIIAITDNGIGISDENKSKLFNKFEQLQSSSESEEKRGSGLGLIIAKGIVEAHKGIIGVSSIEGKGSTFYFTLPV